MSTRFLLAGTSVLLLALASTASAAVQPPDAGPNPGKKIFDRADRNGDGVVDQQEFAAALKILKQRGRQHHRAERGPKARGLEGRRGMRGPGFEGQGEGTGERRHMRKHRREAFRDRQEQGGPPACENRGEMKREHRRRGPKAQGPEARLAGPRGQKQLERKIEARVQRMLKQRLPKMIRRMVREAMSERGPAHGQRGQMMKGHRGHGRGQGRDMERPFHRQGRMMKGDRGHRGPGEGRFQRGEGRRPWREGRFGKHEGRRHQREGRRHRGQDGPPFDSNRGWFNGPEEGPDCPFDGPMMDEGPEFEGDEPMDIGPDEPEEPVEEFDAI